MPEISPVEMFERCLQGLEKLRRQDFRISLHRLAFRDTLLVAILICAPIRLKNLAMIQIGVHLEQCSQDWHLRFEAAETKTHQPLHLVLHPDLGTPLETYINVVRQEFPRVGDTDRLWMANKGKPMAQQTIYGRVCTRSEHLFGVALPPHAFRTIAATFLAETSPEDALHARPLLGHRSLATTENHYIRAQQIQASNKVAVALDAIKSGSKDGG